MNNLAIKTKDLNVRIGLIAFACLVLVLAVFAAKWNFANAVSTKADTKDIADIATWLAPDDPQTRYAAGVIYDKTFEPADAERSLAEFEASAANTPNNYLAWLALSKARGRNGDANGELAAVKRAFDLAPNYASVQWAYGNVLFRNGDERAMQYIRQAAESDKQYRVSSVDLMMLRFDSNVAEVRKALGETPASLAAICHNLVRNQKFAEAMQLWSSINYEDDRIAITEQALAMAPVVLNGKQFRFAQMLFREAGRSSGRIGSVNDGGFEGGVKARGAEAFEWQIADGSEPQIAISNSTKHDGNNSLLLQFNTMEASAFRRVSQTIAVDPGSSFTLSAYYRSELKAQATVKFVITDATSGKALALTESALASSDWKQLSAKFTVPTDSDGIMISLVRADCTSSVCPISGRLWVDNVSLGK